MAKEETFSSCCWSYWWVEKGLKTCSCCGCPCKTVTRKYVEKKKKIYDKIEKECLEAYEKYNKEDPT